MSRRLAELVRKETCATVSAALDLGAFVRVGGGAQRNAVLTANVLGDVCEAVIAALYLDGGIDAARAFVVANWSDRLHASGGSRRDAKTTLQEWSLGRGLPAPVYAIVDRTGPDHATLFTVEVAVGALPSARGEGRSRREAEQDAAGAMLAREGVWKASPPMAAEPTRCGFVALIGAPNAGKSTLVNRLVGTKVSIVSHKVQTTRSIVRGIAMAGDLADRLRRHAGHLRAAPAARPRHGRHGLGRRPGCRSRRAAGRCQEGPRPRMSATSSQGSPTLRQPKILVLNKIDSVNRARSSLCSPTRPTGSFPSSAPS